MRQWWSAAVELERVRLEELRDLDLGRVAIALEDATLEAVRRHPPGPTSGLIEQQRLLHRPPRA